VGKNISLQNYKGYPRSECYENKSFVTEKLETRWAILAKVLADK
jgi:hypothetical protein